jgi:hypothetical protein
MQADRAAGPGDDARTVRTSTLGRMAVTTDELNDALARAALACAARAQNAAETGGQGTVAETWASAAAQLAYAVKDNPAALPARPGIG